MLEGTRNGDYLYDLLHEIQLVSEVQLANACKVRMIAEAKSRPTK